MEKTPIIFKFGKSKYGVAQKAVSKDMLAYLDEDKSIILKDGHEKAALENRLKGITDQSEEAGKIKKRIERLDKRISGAIKRYKANQYKVKIMVRGFFDNEKFTSGKARDDVIKSLTNTWRRELNKHALTRNRVAIRRFILSPGDYEMRDLDLASRKLAMITAIETTMDKFCERYFGLGDDIAYAYAIHNDTKHLHAHLAVFPFTKEGEYISMNSQQGNRRVRAKVEDKFMFLNSTIQHEVSRAMDKVREIEREARADKDFLKEFELLLKESITPTHEKDRDEQKATENIREEQGPVKGIESQPDKAPEQIKDDAITSQEQEGQEDAKEVSRDRSERSLELVDHSFEEPETQQIDQGVELDRQNETIIEQNRLRDEELVRTINNVGEEEFDKLIEKAKRQAEEKRKKKDREEKLKRDRDDGWDRSR